MTLVFVSSVSGGTSHSFVEVDQVTVEFGTVNTCKLGFATNGQTAATAHAGAVDHDGVHGSQSLDAVALGQLANKLHHGQGAQGDDLVVLLAGVDQPLQTGGNQTLTCVRTVVGHNKQLVGQSADFLFQNNQILVTEADNSVNGNAHLVQFTDNGEADSAAGTACNNANALCAGQIGGVTQRANNVCDVFAGLLVAHQLSGSTSNLEYKANGTLFDIPVFDGQGEAFAIFGNTQNAKLACLYLLSDVGRIQSDLDQSRIQGLHINDFYHNKIPPFTHSKCIFWYITCKNAYLLK